MKSRPGTMASQRGGDDECGEQVVYGAAQAQMEISRLQCLVKNLEEQLEDARSQEPQVIVDNSAIEASNKQVNKAMQEIEILQAEKMKLEQNLNKMGKQNKELQ